MARSVVLTNPTYENEIGLRCYPATVDGICIDYDDDNVPSSACLIRSNIFLLRIDGIETDFLKKSVFDGDNSRDKMLWGERFHDDDVP